MALLNYLIYQPSLPPLWDGGAVEGNVMSGISRSLTIHFGFPDPDEPSPLVNDTFRWANPLTGQEGRMGRKCAASHCWFPARMLQEVDGKEYGLPFAPQEQRPGPVTRTWGIEDDE